MKAVPIIATALLLIPVRGEVIDRVAVSVGNHAITSSEILREIRLTALLNRETPVFTPESKRAAADRLIEQHLIAREIEISRFPAPDDAEIDAMLRDVKSVRFNGEQDFRQALETNKIDEADLRKHLVWQMTVLRFIELRFRPGIQVTEQEVKEYFEKQVKQVAGNGRDISLEDYRDRIEKAITGERADRELDSWLKEARSRARIEYRTEAFQ
jgi:hypothetical protein